MADFAKISDIDLTKPDSWKKASFITIDIDWAHDDVLNYAIDLVEQAGVKATWFVTHDTPLLKRMRANPNFELAIHPNFNFILNGTPKEQKTTEEVVDFVLGLVPDAVSVRSHSMTQSTPLMHLFHDKGLKYDCNHFIPHQSGMTMQPWMTWTGLVKVPYFWEDDLACDYGDTTDLCDLSSRTGSLRVFDFHPIHLYLNTEHLDRYENSRPFHQNPSLLQAYVYEGNDGTCSKFKTLVGMRA